MSKLKFGVFMGPWHPQGENPTLLLEEDLRYIEHLDRLGFDEAWFGEHHSGGAEIISSPEIFCAAAAVRTQHIRLGTGVTSASYHHPLWVAERAIQLDHMTRGRFMLGLGPGSLPSDASMIGLNMLQTRDLLADAVDIITRLLRTPGEPVNFENERWTLKDAFVHLHPYSDPHPEIAVAAVNSPSGPRMAGRYGHGLLSIGATTPSGFDALAWHWQVMEERAAHYGVTVDRGRWRVCGFMHLAETREQAYADVAHGLRWWSGYGKTVAFASGLGLDTGNSGEAPPAAKPDLTTMPVEAIADFVNESGIGVIGTPDDAVRAIDRLVERSNGGFGTYLQMVHDWAPTDAKYLSAEMFARHVFPRYQGHYEPTLAARDRAREARSQGLEDNTRAVQNATAKYRADVEAGR